MNEKHGCSCARHLAQGFAVQSINAGEGEIYQISLMSALIDGVYEGRPPLPSCSSTVISALVPSIIWTAN